MKRFSLLETQRNNFAQIIKKDTSIRMELTPNILKLGQRRNKELKMPEDLQDVNLEDKLVGQ
jgi:hypothetical protein